MFAKNGILLINLGTPDSPRVKDVHRYLTEFLTDKRVIDIPWLKRQLLVRGIIIPSRVRQSAAAYEKIWTEKGSPLSVHTMECKQLLQVQLGDSYLVEAAMRYQNPSIESAINKLLDQGITRLLIFPLFPQYASATVGTVYEKVMKIMSEKPSLPEVVFAGSFFRHPAYIEAFAACAIPLKPTQYDHILFSFHGLPKRQLVKSNLHSHCLKSANCCQNICSKNNHCYSAQCHATAKELAKILTLPSEKYTVTFQSRLGKEPWIEPYTQDTMFKLLKKGNKKILVFSPSFVCDCLETTFEIGIEYKQEFLEAGGEKFDLVPGLNTNPKWINALAQMCSSYFNP